MQSFLITLLICSVTMSALALLYMACTPFLAKHYSERGRYYAWLIIVIGLIIPFRPQWGNAIVSVDIPINTETPIVQMDGGAPNTFSPSLTLPPIENSAVSEADTAINISWAWWQIAAAVWLAGVIVFIAYHGIKHYRFIKISRRWSEEITDEKTLSLFESLKSEMRIKKRIPLYMCPCVGSPMMIGIFKPRMFLPTVELAQDELSFILKHELVHYKRKDLLYKHLVIAATAIHWFNPVVYLIAKAINALCEMSCDTDVVQSADMDTRQSYSETIIGVVKYQSKLKTALSTNFYGGKKGMKNRITSIMDTSKKRAGAIILAGALILTLGTSAILATNAAARTQPEQNGIVRFFNPNQDAPPDTIGERVTVAGGAEVFFVNSDSPPNAIVFEDIAGREGEGKVLLFDGVESSPRTFSIGGIDYDSFMREQGQAPIIGNNGEVLMWVPQSFFEMTYEEFNEFAEQLTMLQTQDAVDTDFINILREHWLAAQ
ncbi:MAG: M56 family metallopeptidase [Clostridiales bacterium]|jgi:beta-lactamase regulating signal transducer with metallopeptidase domain|nr:M56 family metallopeptidase [Clostridiales bacterium]